MILEGQNILIISPEAWGDSFVSKHHYASELSRSNKVFFLSPPSGSFLLNQVNRNLHVIQYKPPFRGVNHFPAFLRDFFNASTINKLKNKLNLPDFDVVWSFDPYRFQNLKIFRNSLRIYHPVDVHAAKLEMQTASTADIILTTCTSIENRLIAYNGNTYNIGHGISEQFVKTLMTGRHDVHDRESKRSGLKIGMMGNLQRKIDFAILFRIIRNNPNVEFHFFGPYGPSNLGESTAFSSEIAQLQSFENTVLHGTVPQEKLPEWLESMDVFLVLYREDENPASRANPHKMLEYLAAGNVIVSTFAEEYASKRDLIEMVNRNDDYEDKLSEVLENLDHYNSRKMKKKRTQYARQHTYGNKIDKIQSIIDVHFNRDHR